MCGIIKLQTQIKFYYFINIQEDLLKINKNILNYYSYLQVLGEIRTQKEREKNTSRGSLHYITQTKKKKITHKYIQNKYKCMMMAV